MRKFSRPAFLHSSVSCTFEPSDAFVFSHTLSAHHERLLGVNMRLRPRKNSVVSVHYGVAPRKIAKDTPSDLQDRKRDCPLIDQGPSCLTDGTTLTSPYGTPQSHTRYPTSRPVTLLGMDSTDRIHHCLTRGWIMRQFWGGTRTNIPIKTRIHS